jgi:hypothetical protein
VARSCSATVPGGGVAAPDLLAATDALTERVSVALVEQAYRVAGARRA